ncbi:MULTISPECIES: antitoxin VbhA family protein [Actinomycetes]|uniref:antitoxin VbhA family protein n=1 Tax=Actinomycetes TaxID=1760 RepID=UPI0005268CB1|nr:MULTISPECIES: antitoxin VbhA family protein [Actinomycetes]MCK0515800.1 antitoxin VbhA family protein [Williamsia sp. DF01-3]
MTQEPEWAVRYPDLFAELTIEQKWSVHNTIASNEMEGWEPTRDNVADLIALTRGLITLEEFVRRGRAALDAQASSNPPTTT